MARYLLLLSLLAALTGLAELPAQESRFFWGPQLYPNLSAPRLIAQGNLSQDEIEAIQDREIGKPAYALGLEAGWMGDKAGFRFGLRFAETGYRTVREPWPADLPNPSGALERREVFSQYRLDLPVSLDFSHQLSDANRFFFSLGLAAGIHLNANTTEILYFGDTQRRRTIEDNPGDLRPLNAAFTTGMGWEGRLGEDLSLSLSPLFQFWLSPLYREAALNRSLYSVGLHLALRFYRP